MSEVDLIYLQEVDLNCSWDSNCPLVEPDRQEEEEEEVVVFPEWEPIDDWWPAPVGEEEEGYGSGEEDLAPPPQAFTWEEEDEEDEDEEHACLIRRLRQLLSKEDESAQVLQSVSEVCQKARDERRRRQEAEEEARQAKEQLREAMKKLDDQEYALAFERRQVNSQKEIVGCLFKRTLLCFPVQYITCSTKSGKVESNANRKEEGGGTGTREKGGERELKRMNFE